MKFTAAIDEYLADMKAQGRINSPRTERSYFSRLAMHADDVSNRDPRATGRQDVKRTLRRWSHPNTQANARAILVSFYDWTMEEGIRPDNPARQVRRPKKRPTSVYRLTRAEAAAMLDARSMLSQMSSSEKSSPDGQPPVAPIRRPLDVLEERGVYTPVATVMLPTPPPKPPPAQPATPEAPKATLRGRWSMRSRRQAMEQSDPRIEAAAKAILSDVPWAPKWDAVAEEVRRLCRLDARRALAAADAVDPLRDRDRMLEAMDRLAATVRERDEARAERDNVSVEAHHWMGQAARYREALERIDRESHWRTKDLRGLGKIAREALGAGAACPRTSAC